MGRFNVNCFDTLDYKLFKLLQELSYVDTFGKDEMIRKKYREYLKDQKKHWRLYLNENI